jgi:hypothetical protein
MSYSDVLKLTRQLPFDAQIELAEAILHNIRSALGQSPGSTTEAGLSPLTGMNERELKALAEAVVAPEKQQELGSLLQENCSQSLSPADEAALDSLLDEVDQVALLKARALYTLHLQQPISQTDA